MNERKDTAGDLYVELWQALVRAGFDPVQILVSPDELPEPPKTRSHLRLIQGGRED